SNQSESQAEKQATDQVVQAGQQKEKTGLTEVSFHSEEKQAEGRRELDAPSRQTTSPQGPNLEQLAQQVQNAGNPKQVLRTHLA
ncbi:hypothetical protein, partial [Aerococcus urinae]